jgi:hypothetical protein
MCAIPAHDVPLIVPLDEQLFMIPLLSVQIPAESEDCSVKFISILQFDTTLKLLLTITHLYIAYHN